MDFIDSVTTLSVGSSPRRPSKNPFEEAQHACPTLRHLHMHALRAVFEYHLFYTAKDSPWWVMLLSSKELAGFSDLSHSNRTVSYSPWGWYLVKCMLSCVQEPV